MGVAWKSESQKNPQRELGMSREGLVPPSGGESLSGSFPGFSPTSCAPTASPGPGLLINFNAAPIKAARARAKRAERMRVAKEFSPRAEAARKRGTSAAIQDIRTGGGGEAIEKVRVPEELARLCLCLSC